MLGLYVTGHPLDEYRTAIQAMVTRDSSVLLQHEGDDEISSSLNAEARDQEKVIFAGLIVSRRARTTRNKEMMAIMILEDLAGTCEVLAFPRVYQQFSELLREGQTVLLAGKLSLREDDNPKLIAELVSPLDPRQTRRPPEFERYLANCGNGSYASGNRRPADRQAAPAIGQQTAAQAAGAAEPADGADAISSGDAKPETTNTNSNQDKKPDTRNDGQPNANAAAVRTLAIRYLGERDDPGYQRLLAMLRFFHGSMRVRVYLANDRTGHELPADCWIEADDKILAQIARRYGMSNIALL